MSKSKIFFIIVSAIAAVAVAKKTGFGLILEVPAMLSTLWLMFKYRREIARWFKSFKLPVFLIALLSYLPFMLYEENINCLPSGCKLIPDTVTILTIFIIGFLGLSKLFRAKGIKLPLIFFAVFGIFIELTIGASAAAFRALPIHWFIFIVFWVGLSYIYIALIPATVLIESNDAG